MKKKFCPPDLEGKERTVAAVPADRMVESFLILCETLNYAQAARRLFLSHQALSRQIARLEEELGHTLFVRSTRSVRLTAVGELYRAYFQEERERYARVRTEAERLEYVGRNDLRIGYPLGVGAPEPVAAAVERFRRERPEVGIHMEWYDVDALPGRFAGDALDLVITVDDSDVQEYADCRRLFLMETQRVLLVSRRHPCFGAERLDQFSGQVFYYEASGSSQSDQFLRENIAQTLERAGVSQPSIEQLPNLQSRQNAVELGLGCCLCLDVDTLCANPSIRAIPLDTPPSGISCYWKPDSGKPAVGAFAALLAELHREHLEER